MKNIRYMKYVSFVLLLVFSLFLIHCSGGGGGDSGGSSGGSSSDSSKTMSQSTIDNDVMWAVYNSIIVLYNQNVSGTPSGQKNLLGRSCPYGGTVDITGTTSVNNGTNVDLNFLMFNCKTKITQSSRDVEIAMTGLMEWNGTFNSTTRYKDWHYQATDIFLEGTIQHSSYEDTDFAELVDFVSHATQNNSDSVNVSGTIYGRSVSMTLGSGSSGGSDGGSGGGSCTDNYYWMNLYCTLEDWQGSRDLCLGMNGGALTGSHGPYCTFNDCARAWGDYEGANKICSTTQLYTRITATPTSSFANHCCAQAVIDFEPNI